MGEQTSLKVTGPRTAYTKTYMTEPETSSTRMQPWHSTIKTAAIYTEPSGVGLEAILLHTWDGMWFPRNEAPNNAALWPIAFATQKAKC